MPLYPFLLLGATFLAVMILPPLIAAYIDHRRQLRAEASEREPPARARREEDDRG